MTTSYQIGIYCYFDFDLNREKLRSFPYAKRKASINAINMYKPYTDTGHYPRGQVYGAKVMIYLHVCK